MPMFQYGKHTLHCILGVVSSNSNSSTLPTSRIICFYSGLKGLNDWFCRRSCSRACRFWWFSSFWIKSRTLVLCACFTTECGSPGILKSMSASFTIIGSWFSSWTMDFSILSRSSSSSMLSVLASWFTWVVLYFSCVSNRSPCSDMSVCSTLRLLLSSDERVWFTSVSTGLRVLSEELSSSWKELTSISWERNVFLSSCMSISRPDLSRIGFGVDWVDWFVEQLLFLVVEQLHFQVVEQLSNPFHLSNRDVMRSLVEVEVTSYTFPFETSPVSILTTFGLISWKCFLKNDRIRSSLIECQSFADRKIDVDRIYRVLMFLPCIAQVLCTTWYIQVNLFRIFVTLSL